MSNKLLANNLKKLRQEINYTQEQVAELLMVSSQSVSRWECGNTLPDVMILPEIAKIYGVIVDDLFKEDILGYKNYAQRLLAVYESTGNVEDFITAEKEFQKLFIAGCYTADDLRACGLLYYYMMKNCKKQAMNYFDKVICEYKTADEEAYYRTWQQKMILLEECGKGYENIKIQSKALEADINNPKQWILLIAAYYYAKDNENAYEWAVKAMKRFPDEALIYVYVGDICRNLKKYEEALQYWNKALELDDTYLDAKYSIGFCYEEIGDYEKAYTVWKELAEELDRRGLAVDKQFPLQLAKKYEDKKM